MVSAEQKEYAEVFDYSKITEKSGVITDYGTNNLLDLILRTDNLNNAYKQVKKNKGKGGIDGMQVDELLPFLREASSVAVGITEYDTTSDILLVNMNGIVLVKGTDYEVKGTGINVNVTLTNSITGTNVIEFRVLKSKIGQV